MIFTEKNITINNNECKIDSPVILYRGDYNVEVRFTLISCPYKYSKKDSVNVIETTEASYGQLVIKTAGDKAPIFSEVTATNNGTITFIIAVDMIDEISEVGNYTFQIRLFDENQQSRKMDAVSRPRGWLRNLSGLHRQRFRPEPGRHDSRIGQW